ncbi:MAG: ABC transporter permease subunit [Clostridia bacterium]|nr:ABC transporter permease subunit [Clostridia bacterium]
MRSKTAKKLIKVLLAIAFWAVVWEAASFLISDNLKMFLPSPVIVVNTFFRLFGKSTFWAAVFYSFLRVFEGFALGVVCGIIAGILTGRLKAFDIILSPAMQVIRAVPVVSFIILAFLFIRVDILPIVVCMFMVMPIVWQTVNDELVGFDKGINEMAEVFKVKGFKKLLFVTVPTVSDAVISTILSGAGLAWKSGIATEVLCAPAVSIGKSLLKAKNLLNFDEVYAFTLTVIILSMVFEFLLKYLYSRRKARRIGNG